MQKIYLLRENESPEKIAKITGYELNKISIQSSKILGKSYAILEDGTADIILIENYFPPRLHKVQDGETKEYFQSLGYEISKENIKENDIILLTKIEGKKHIVKPLETLENIANQYYTSMQDLIKRNNLKTDKLFIGQILWIWLKVA